MTLSFSLQMTELSLWNSQAKSLLWVSRMRLLSHQADLEQHLRQEVIQLGTQHHLHSLRITHCTFLHHSFHIQVKFLIRKLLYFAVRPQSTRLQEEFWLYSVNSLRELFHMSVLNRNISLLTKSLEISVRTYF